MCTTKFNLQRFTLYLYVLCGAENKQQFFPYTASTDWFL